VSHVTIYDPALRERVATMTHKFTTLGVDPVRAAERAYGMIYGSLQRQAAMLGYIDTIFIFACVLALMTPAAFLMKKVTGRAPRRGGH
jgi:MFS transporter, DHA2 family, multidrug resistance protein